MRAIFSVIGCLVATTAMADLYEVRVPFGSNITLFGPMPSQADATFIVRPLGGSMPILSWTVPNVTPAHSGMVWSINEVTAPFDWSLLEFAVDDPTGWEFGGTFTDTAIHGWWPEYHVQKVTSVEFDLHQYFVSPVGSVSNWSFNIVGDGYHVPEPSAVPLAVMAACCLLWRTRL